jgi:predicted DNA-binding transcriptional regulator YafY
LAEAPDHHEGNNIDVDGYNAFKILIRDRCFRVWKQKFEQTTDRLVDRLYTVGRDAQRQAAVSHYFKRRKMYPTQEIKEERPDGSLVITFKVGNLEAVYNVLKCWIPHFLILQPRKFRKEMLADVKQWVMRQEGRG